MDLPVKVVSYCLDAHSAILLQCVSLVKMVTISLIIPAASVQCLFQVVSIA